MKRSKLAATMIATVVLATSHFALASGALSMNPNACRLVSNTSPQYDISSASTGPAGQFGNNSGGYAWGMCPVPWQDGAYNFIVSTSNTTAACYLFAVSIWGGGTTVYTGSRSGNQVFFSVGLTAGSYNADIQCFLPNGSFIWGAENYF